MRPGISFLVFLILWLLLSVAAFFSPLFHTAWVLSAAAGFVLISIEFLYLLLIKDQLLVQREMHNALALDEKSTVTLVLERKNPAAVPTLSLFDLYPDAFICTQFPLYIHRSQWKNSNILQLQYEILPHRRGEWEFSHLELLYNSPLLFWKKKQSKSLVTRGKTYPNYKNMLRLAAAELHGRSNLTGLIMKRQRGQGMEFRNLREYQRGDSIRDIDWRASSRRGKPIVREYQEEQDQQLVIMLDSGYRLHRLDADMLQFDAALNTAMMLSYVALKHNDSVALHTFGNDERWIRPQKGLGSLYPLMNKIYDLQSAPVPSSPSAALEKVLARLHKRSFIILISNFREEDNETLSWILSRIRRQHILLLASLRETEAEACATRTSSTVQDAMVQAAAFKYLQERKNLYATWEQQGLLCLDSTAEQLSSAVINQYLDLKSAGTL